MSSTKKIWLIRGFKKCGIYPLDRNQVYTDRLPSEGNSRETNLQIDKCLISILKAAKGKNDAAPQRGKKISIAPGKDICFNWKRCWIRRWSREWIRRWIRYGYWIRGRVARHELQWSWQWQSWSQTKFQGFCEGFSQNFWLGSSEVWHSQLIKIKSSIQYFVGQNILVPWCGGYHHCTISFNKTWTQVRISESHGWEFLYELSGFGFESSCSHLKLHLFLL